MSRVRCSCGHTWETRKPTEEIERLRCSECGTTSEDEISIAPTKERAPTTSDSTIISNVEAEATREDLLERVQQLIDRVDDTGPDDSDKRVSKELRGEYRRLCELETALQDRDETIPLYELQAIGEFVDERAAGVEEHADELDRIEHLEATVKGLQRKISTQQGKQTQLSQEVEALREECETLQSRKRQLETKVGTLEEEAASYGKGYEDGMNDWKIWIPCGHCGGPIRVEPGQPLHQKVINNMKGQIYHSPSCRQAGERSNNSLSGNPQPNGFEIP